MNKKTKTGPLSMLNKQTLKFVTKLIDDGANIRKACQLGIALDKGEIVDAVKVPRKWQGFAIEAGFITEKIETS
jgi:hypothetical protein